MNNFFYYNISNLIILPKSRFRNPLLFTGLFLNLDYILFHPLCACTDTENGDVSFCYYSQSSRHKQRKKGTKKWQPISTPLLRVL